MPKGGANDSAPIATSVPARRGRPGTMTNETTSSATVVKIIARLRKPSGLNDENGRGSRASGVRRNVHTRWTRTRPRSWASRDIVTTQYPPNRARLGARVVLMAVVCRQMGEVRGRPTRLLQDTRDDLSPDTDFSRAPQASQERNGCRALGRCRAVGRARCGGRGTRSGGGRAGRPGGGARHGLLLRTLRSTGPACRDRPREPRGAPDRLLDRGGGWREP